MRSSHVLLAAATGFLALVTASHGANALDGKLIFEQNCVSCHNVAGPAPTTFEGVLKRKAPDLFYAGSKFNRPWLVLWLQGPTPIRPSGVMFLRHIVSKGGKDMVEDGKVQPCPAKLGPERAEVVTDYLMTLTDTTMKTGVIDPAKKFSKPKALRLFRKQLPCIGCHTIRFGKRRMGGISGPSLIEAGKRLNPDWVYARIENPQYWDPKTWMPRLEMSHKKRGLLTLFIASMK
ncbi:MAG: hypothetical protein ACE5JZ_01940 [Kiloniellales bacterium]